MSDEGINKIKDFIKAKTEVVAEKAGQRLGEVVFEARKAYEAASPLAKSAMADVAQAAKAAKASFDQAMEEAEARAKVRAADAAREEATRKADGSSGSGPGL